MIISIFRKTFSNLGDPGDITIPEDTPVSVIWAIGKMAEVRHRVKEPSFHHTYTRQHTQIGQSYFRNSSHLRLLYSDFTSKDKVNTCFSLTSNREETNTPWFINPIFNPSKRSFSARLGPAGGKRGYR